ncbi:MAG: hypothetical protein V4467_02815 [Patescibacteria group bacterium]
MKTSFHFHNFFQFSLGFSIFLVVVSGSGLLLENYWPQSQSQAASVLLALNERVFIPFGYESQILSQESLLTPGVGGYLTTPTYTSQESNNDRYLNAPSYAPWTNYPSSDASSGGANSPSYYPFYFETESINHPGKVAPIYTPPPSPLPKRQGVAKPAGINLNSCLKFAPEMYSISNREKTVTTFGSGVDSFNISIDNKNPPSILNIIPFFKDPTCIFDQLPYLNIGETDTTDIAVGNSLHSFRASVGGPSYVYFNPMEFLQKSTIDENSTIEAIDTDHTLKFSYGKLDDPSPIVAEFPATNCVQLSGTGPNKIVFMRGSALAESVGDFLSQAQSIIDDGFKTIEPFKTYQDQFSFYVDLMEVEQSKLPTDPGAYNTEALKSVSKCGGNSTEYMLIFSNKNMQNGVSFTDYGASSIYLNLATDTGTSLPVNAIHEMGHAFSYLADEYELDLREPPKFQTNCTLHPLQDYRSSIDHKLYGRVDLPGCTCPAKVQCENYYRPSSNSVMRHSNESSQFNVISCGYILARIKDNDVKKSTAEKYWPECMKMDGIIKEVSSENIVPVISSAKLEGSNLTSMNVKGMYFAPTDNTVEMTTNTDDGESGTDIKTYNFTNINNSSPEWNRSELNFNVPAEVVDGAYDLKVQTLGGRSNIVKVLVKRQCPVPTEKPNLTYPANSGDAVNLPTPRVEGVSSLTLCFGHLNSTSNSIIISGSNFNSQLFSPGFFDYINYVEFTNQDDPSVTYYTERGTGEDQEQTQHLIISGKSYDGDEEGVTGGSFQLTRLFKITDPKDGQILIGGRLYPCQGTIVQKGNPAGTQYFDSSACSHFVAREEVVPGNYSMRVMSMGLGSPYYGEEGVLKRGDWSNAVSVKILVEQKKVAQTCPVPQVGSYALYSDKFSKLQASVDSALTNTKMRRTKWRDETIKAGRGSSVLEGNPALDGPIYLLGIMKKDLITDGNGSLKNDQGLVDFFVRLQSLEVYHDSAFSNVTSSANDLLGFSYMFSPVKDKPVLIFIPGAGGEPGWRSALLLLKKEVGMFNVLGYTYNPILDTPGMTENLRSRFAQMVKDWPQSCKPVIVTLSMGSTLIRSAILADGLGPKNIFSRSYIVSTGFVAGAAEFFGPLKIFVPLMPHVYPKSSGVANVMDPKNPVYKAIAENMIAINDSTRGISNVNAIKDKHNNFTDSVPDYYKYNRDLIFTQMEIAKKKIGVEPPNEYINNNGEKGPDEPSSHINLLYAPEVKTEIDSDLRTAAAHDMQASVIQSTSPNTDNFFVRIFKTLKSIFFSSSEEGVTEVPESLPINSTENIFDVSQSFFGGVDGECDALSDDLTDDLMTGVTGLGVQIDSLRQYTQLAQSNLSSTCTFDKVVSGAEVRLSQIVHGSPIDEIISGLKNNNTVNPSLSFKNSSRVPSQVIVLNKQVPLGGFTATLKGLPVTVKKLPFTLTNKGTEKEWSKFDISNIELRDKNGIVVSKGLKSATENEIVFNNSFTIASTSDYAIFATIKSDFKTVTLSANFSKNGAVFIEAQTGKTVESPKTDLILSTMTALAGSAK